jgi:hypothetical protein
MGKRAKGKKTQGSRSFFFPLPLLPIFPFTLFPLSFAFSLFSTLTARSLDKYIFDLPITGHRFYSSLSESYWQTKTERLPASDECTICGDF